MNSAQIIIGTPRIAPITVIHSAAPIRNTTSAIAIPPMFPVLVVVFFITPEHCWQVSDLIDMMLYRSVGWDKRSIPTSPDMISSTGVNPEKGALPGGMFFDRTGFYDVGNLVVTGPGHGRLVVSLWFSAKYSGLIILPMSW